MKEPQELEKFVRQRLEEIRAVPPRDPHMASRGRAQFLSRAVSAAPLLRQKGWIFDFRKERYAMNVLLSILVIAGLLFGGSATVVGAAQDDLPNEPLYALKTWSEDFSLQLQNSPEAKVDRLMELTQIRIHEMTQLTEEGQPIPDQLRVRLEKHIQQALQLCAQMDDPAMERALLQVREQLVLQVEEMTQLQSRAREQAFPTAQQQIQIMNQTQTMLQQRLEVADEGLQNRELFREQAQNGFQFGQEEDFVPPEEDGNGEQNGQPDAFPSEPSPAPGESGNPSPSPDPAPNPSPNPTQGGHGGNGNGSGGGGKP
ncbi:MAG: hypothetical protein HXY42_14805 [Chloroflexi bacterium]|nr:hypothetical protein [Chloroflexota bacterium]